jgi:hypothetical protein
MRDARPGTAALRSEREILSEKRGTSDMVRLEDRMWQ